MNGFSDDIVGSARDGDVGSALGPARAVFCRMCLVPSPAGNTSGRMVLDRYK